jgi:hypothetical protein
VTMSYTWTIDHLISEKKRMWLLEKGKTVQIQQVQM